MKKPCKVFTDKVCKVSPSDTKILSELMKNPEGLRVKSLCEYCDMKRRTVYKRLNILRKLNLVENVFPIWKICLGGYQKCSQLLSGNNIFELHNLSYVVKLLRKPDWWSNRKNYLMRLKGWDFKNIDFGRNPYQQLKNEHFVIQAYPQSLIIICRKRYSGDNPYTTCINALNDVLDLLDWFCERFRFNFFLNGVPHLEVRSNDFNRLNDYIANKIKEEDGRFLVRLDNRRKVWVDLSEPFGKEANYPNAQEILEKHTKDLLLNEPSLPSVLERRLNTCVYLIDGLIKTQDMNAQNIIKHQKVLDDMSASLNKISSGIDTFINLANDLRDYVKKNK